MAVSVAALKPAPAAVPEGRAVKRTICHDRASPIRADSQPAIPIPRLFSAAAGALPGCRRLGRRGFLGQRLCLRNLSRAQSPSGICFSASSPASSPAPGFALFLRVLDYNPLPLPVALGLPLDRTATRQFGTGLGLGALLITADVAYHRLLRLAATFISTSSRYMLLRAAAVAVLLFCAALLEELTFRGYPFQKLTEAWAPSGPSSCSPPCSGPFILESRRPGAGSVGDSSTPLPSEFSCALARIRSGSLWFPFGLHFGWNLFQGAVFGLPVSGLREFSSLVTAITQGPPALTGGDYGPEASVTCAMVLFLALPLLWFLTASPRIQHRPASLPPTSAN